MKVIEGRDVVLEFFSGEAGTYLPFICAENCGMDLDATLLPTKTRGDGNWETYLMDTKSYIVTCDGVIPYGQASVGVTVWDLYPYFDQMTDVPYRMIFRDNDDNLVKAIYGYVLIKNIKLTGPMDFAGQSLSFVGNGRPNVQDNLLACQAEIADVVVTLQNDLRINFTYSGLAGATRVDYAVDGGSRDTHFAPMSGGLIYILAVFNPGAFTVGEHSVNFYPVCDSGEDGTPFTLNYTVAP